MVFDAPRLPAGGVMRVVGRRWRRTPQRAVARRSPGSSRSTRTVQRGFSRRPSRAALVLRRIRRERNRRAYRRLRYN